MQIKIRNLHKTYPNGTQALKNISLNIPVGMFGLLGPDGAGKTSLLRILATLQEADRGNVTFGDTHVLSDKTRMRQIVGYLPQEFGVYSGVSAERLLTHLASLKGITNAQERQEQVESLLHQTNLDRVRHKPVSSYSREMRQRFGIAQALLGNPQIILADEPTAGLDPAERVGFLDLLSQVSEKVTVVLATNLVEDVSELCSQMAILAQGQLLLTGKPLDLMQRLEGKIWLKTIERRELPAFQANFRVISHPLFLGQIQVRIHSNERPDDSWKMIQPDLGDVYFCTMQGWLKPQAETTTPVIL